MPIFKKVSVNSKSEPSSPQMPTHFPYLCALFAVISISFNNGTYEYKVKVTLSGGMDYTADESCSGTYTLNGDKLSMSGKMSEGTIYGTSVTLKGYLSSFAGSEETVTVFK